MMKKITALVIRFKWAVLAIWVIATILLTFFAPNLSEILKTDNSSFLPENSKTTNASKLINTIFPDEANRTSFVLVISREPKLTEQDEQYIKNLDKYFNENKDELKIIEVVSPYTNEALKEQLISKDKVVAILNLRVNSSPYTEIGKKSLNDVKDTINKASLSIKGESFTVPKDLLVQVTGDAAIDAEQLQTTNDSMDIVTKITIVLLLLILIIIYRSPVAPMLPLFTIALSFLISRGIIGVLTLWGFNISTFTETFLIAVLFGVGTDYCMLIISRFKEEFSSGKTKNEALLASMPITSEAIISSGGTEIIGFLFMIFAKFGLFNTTGPSVAIGVAITILAVITLIPALISILGNVIFWPIKNNINHKKNLHNGIWSKLATIVTKKPIRFIVIPLIAFVPFIIASTNLKISYDVMKDLPSSNSSIKGFEIMSEHFSKGDLMPVKVTIKTNKDLYDTNNLKILDSIADDLLKVENVSTVRTASRPLGKKLTEASLSTQILLLSEGIDKIEDGFAPLNDGITKIKENVIKIEQGIKTGGNALNGKMYFGLNDLKSATEQTKNAYDDILSSINNSIISLEKLKNEQPSLQANADFGTAYLTLQGISQNFSTLQQGLIKIQDGISQASNGIKQAGDDFLIAANGLDIISKSLEPINSGIIEMSEGLKKIIDQTSKYSNNNGVGDIFYLPNDVFALYPEFKKAVSNYISPNGDGATFDIVLSVTPYSTKALDTISKIENTVKFSLKGTDLENSEFVVSGATSAFAEIRDFIARDMKVVIIFVLLGIFIILSLLLRSLIAPIYLILTIVLSYMFTLGISNILFVNILGQDGLHWSVPFFSFCVIVALGVDYNIFLMSRVKEEYIEGQMKKSVTRALSTTGAIITSCGIIMAGTFGAMLGSPLRPMYQIGFAACFGLIIDTFIIRSLVVPAIAVKFGEMNWWPGRKIKVSSFSRKKQKENTLK